MLRFLYRQLSYFLFYSNAVKYKCKRKRIFQNNLLSSNCSSDRSNGSNLDVDFNPDMGLANNILKAMHLPVSTWLSGESSVIPTLVFINLWTTGSTMVIFLAGMQDVPRQLLEAVEIDGGGFWAKLLHVTIPMMTPTIFYNVVMGIINGFQIFTQSYVMTQGGPNNSSLFYVYYLYREAFEFGRMGNACAVAWVLFLIIMVLTAVIFKFSNRWVYYGGE